MKKVSLAAIAFLIAMSVAPVASAAAPLLGWHGRHGRVRIGVGFGFGYWPGYYYSPYYAPYGGYYRPYGYGERGGRWSVIDTDISPEESRVYLDGKYIGTADDFDGNPDFLYLQPGRYRVEFRLEGYETQSVDVNARTGQYLDLTNELKKTPGARQYGSYDTPTPEGGVRRFWGKKRNQTEPYSADRRDRNDRYDRYDRDRDRDEREYRRDRDDRQDDPEYRDEQERRPDDREEDRRWQDDGEDDGSPESDTAVPEPQARSDRDRESRADESVVRPETAVRPERDGKTRLRLRVEPRDAAVYLDDRFIGTAEEVGSLSAGVSVRPGKHRITVSRPGMKDRSEEVELEVGKTESLEIKLER